MREVNTWHHVSADGFIAATDGGLDWVVDDPEVQRASMARFAMAGALLFGRKTYEIFAARWLRVLDRANHHSRPSTPELIERALFLTAMPKVVFSRSLDKPKWQNTRIVRELEPRGIARMKQDAGKEVLVLGSRSIVEQLCDQGLVDHYDLVISPTMLREGRTLLSPGKRTELRFVQATPFAAGCLLVRYARAD